MCDNAEKASLLNRINKIASKIQYILNMWAIQQAKTKTTCTLETNYWKTKNRLWQVHGIHDFPVIALALHLSTGEVTNHCLSISTKLEYKKLTTSVDILKKLPRTDI